MGQPLGIREGLCFANSIIEGTVHEEAMVSFKTRLNIRGSDESTLGSKYWRNFRRRHEDILESSSGETQASARREWSTHLNFKMMYDLVYDRMKEARILETLDKPVWMNREGEIVMSAEEALGMKVTHRVKHPEYMLFVDEVGNNTNMKDDGKVGGEQFLKEKGQRAKITAATTDAHFTVLGFTAATGEPVMCAIIFPGHELTSEQHLGVDIQFPMVDGDFSMRANSGSGKRFPGGPKCSFQGKEVPAFICCSPKGGITSELLKEMLERMDSFNLFPRIPGGPLPFLLLDGHGSRLQLPFLRYTNDPDHPWIVCLGLPNGTALWQVGDAAEQNGCWKMAITKFKRDLVLFKMRMGLPHTITKTDIVPLCNRAFANSFAQVPSNQHAIADRGWNPLNRALLLNTEVLKTKIVKIVDYDTETEPPRNIFTGDQSVISSISSTSSVAQTLNLTSGSAGTIITDMLQYALKEVGVCDNLKKRYEEGKKIRGELFEGKKRVTAGLLFKASQLGLDTDVLNSQERKERIGHDTRELARLKAVKEYTMRKDTALKILALKKPIAALGVKELKALVQYKKRKCDGAVPTSKKDLVGRYEDICYRPDQTIETYLSSIGHQ